VRSARLVLIAAVVTAGAPAGAYDQKVHALLSERGFAGDPTVAGDASAVALLRQRIWHAGAEAKDPELRRRFLARWPAREAFDAWAMKQLFSLNPDKHVAGFDDDVALPADGDARAVYATASRLPDDDERNRDRFRHLRREVTYDQWGRPLPADPATLEMGSLTGLSSQAHAHYGLPHLAFSDEPSVLKTDPRRFAVPPTVHTFGADFAESYTILAVLASRLPNGQRLALTHAGAAAHHLEDVANQIHTVQVGIYEFFVDAKIQSIKEELLSVGGLLRPHPSFMSIGLDIIANHHVLAESLYAKHLLTPNDPVAVQTTNAPPDDAFQHTLDGIPPSCTSGFGRAIAEALIERSSYEGPEVYRAVRGIAQHRWSRAGQHFDEHDDPDDAIKTNARVDGFYALEAAGARRATQTLAAWWARFRACAALDDAAVDALAEQLVRERLDALDATDARVRSWTPKPPEPQTRTWWVPALYVVVLLVIILLVVRRVRRGARSEASPDRAPPRR
jgi:hypothetical protein